MENEEKKDEKRFWKCSKCGYTLQANVPPETCPACKEKCPFFDSTSYLPDDDGDLDRRL